MSDRIAAAEAILATLAAARGRLSALAHAHLPFDRALALELRATVGASAERAQLELSADMIERRMALLRGLRAPARGFVLEPAPVVSLPVSVGPQDAEDVGDESTPVSLATNGRVLERVVLEPEPEITVSAVSTNTSSSAPAPRIDDALPISMPPVDEAGRPSQEVGFTLAESGEDEDADEPSSEDLSAQPTTERPTAADEPAPRAAPEEQEPELVFDLDDADLDEDVAEPETQDIRPLDLRSDQRAPVDLAVEDRAPAELASEDLQPVDLSAEDLAPVESVVEEPSRGEEEEPPLSFDHLVRFVAPVQVRPVGPPEDDEGADEPGAREPLTDEHTPADGAGDEDDIDDELLDEAVQKALHGEEPSIISRRRDLGLEDEPSINDSPTIPTTLEAFVEAEQPLFVEDGGTEDLASEDEEPPVAPPVHRHHAAEPADTDDEEPGIAGAPRAAASARVIDAEPPRRESSRPASVPLHSPARPRPETALEVGADEADDGGDEGPSLQPARGGAGFTVTLERPQREEEEEEESVYDLSSVEEDAAPRLTDEDEGYALPSASEAPPPAPEIDLELAAEFLRKAREAEARGDLSKAIVHYQDLLDLTPDSVEGYLGRGRSFMEMGDYAAAMSDFQRAEDLDPKSPEPLVEMGNLFFARKEYRRAIEFYDQAIEIDPTHAMARCRRGICHHYRKNHKQAFQDLQRAYSLNPDIPNIRKYVQMAVKAMEKGR